MVAASVIAIQRSRADAAKGRKPKAPVHGQFVKNAGAAAYGQRKDTAAVRILLPVPVSVNAIYSPRKGGGLRLSDAYSAWIRDAGWRLIEQRPGRVAGRYQITVWIPEESGADLDNLIKATSDLLQLHGIVRNDRLASRVVLEWHNRHSEAVVEVIPTDLPSNDSLIVRREA
jgi:crossover junction endodeoxyribonuclease RusA